MKKALAVSDIDITIPDWHPTPLNKLMTTHWAKAGRMKKVDRGMVAAYFCSTPKAIKPRQMDLHIYLAKGQRACDPDAYLKSLLDALVHCGALKDDSAKWCRIGAIEFTRADSPATRIVLTDLHAA